MTACPAAAASPDVLIRRDAKGRFAVGSLNSSPQLECASFEDALHCAGRFAAREAADLWYASDETTPCRLADGFSLRRLWNEFVELPNLHLTREQVQRLLDVDAVTSEAVLAVLVEVGLLNRCPDGRYEKTTSRRAPIPPLRCVNTASRVTLPRG
jgi:hypothetical protein